MAFTVVISTGHFVDYGDKDTYAVNENGVLTVTIGANNRVNRQIYSPNGWLEVVETTDGTEDTQRAWSSATSRARGHSLRKRSQQIKGSCRAAGLVRVGSESVGVG
jgi:hypothetical protein